MTENIWYPFDEPETVVVFDEDNNYCFLCDGIVEEPGLCEDCDD